MKSLSRRISIALLAGGLMITPAVAEVHAVSWGNILRGAINIGSTHAAVDSMDRDQEGMLRETQARTGVYADSAYQERAKRIIRDLQDTGIPERSYVIYVNPSEDINAFCTLAGVLSVNKGLMDIMDDDCLAFVLAHEISHGEHRDSVNGITKQVTLANAAGIALGNAGAAEAIVANIALQYVNNEVFTMNQEKMPTNSALPFWNAASTMLAARRRRCSLCSNITATAVPRESYALLRRIRIRVRPIVSTSHSNACTNFPASM